jgi:hypothetical protein
VAAHLQKPAIVRPLAADEDRVHGGFHVVVNPAPAGAAKKGKRAVVRVEHHLLRLARVGAHEQHPANFSLDWEHKSRSKIIVTAEPSQHQPN